MKENPYEFKAKDFVGSIIESLDKNGDDWESINNDYVCLTNPKVGIKLQNRHGMQIEGRFGSYKFWPISAWRISAAVKRWKKRSVIRELTKQESE